MTGTQRRATWPIIGGALVVAIVLAGLAAATLMPPPDRTISGSLTIEPAESVQRSETDCRGTGIHSDIRAGLPVTVTDEAGAVIATGRLELAAPATRCRFAFRIDVPDRPSYSLELGSRGSVTYSREQLEALGWTVDMTTGG